jgi:hypothetical protein
MNMAICRPGMKQGSVDWGLRRGVVRLFNAVAKAQRQQKEAAEGPKGKAAPVSKAAFLAELHGEAIKPQVRHRHPCW